MKHRRTMRLFAQPGAGAAGSGSSRMSCVWRRTITRLMTFATGDLLQLFLSQFLFVFA